MQETAADLSDLQALIDRSMGGIRSHQMRDIFAAERALSARQICAYLQGVKHVACATVTAGGEPRVRPLDGLFYRGRFHVGTAGSALTIRHLRRRPAISLTHFAGDDVGVIVHGVATIMSSRHEDVGPIHQLATAVYESDPFGWGDDVVFVRVEPSAMYTYAKHPERFAEEAAR
ncbi:MAG: pyridoxamine 5'-phosphate oxidase family protein [Candidatus Limnocylindria bacterium]